MSFITEIKALLADVADVFTQNYEQQQALISGFLQNAENDTIRMYVADASGMGHQANTVMIMYRLIQLGFNHNFQVIYDNSSGATAAKLARLITGFVPNDTGDPQDVPLNAATTATMMSLAYFRTNIADYPLVNFGFTGGFDSNPVNLANAPIPETADSKGVKVNFFLKLQPFQWTKEIAIQQPGQLPAAFVKLTTVASLGLASFTKRGYYVEPPQAPAEETFTGPNAAKYAPYQRIIAACTGADANVNLLPVYGIGDTATPGYVEANPEMRPQNILLYLIAAVRYAQRYSGLANLQRGAIIVVIATVSQGCYDTLNQLLMGIANAERNTTLENLNQFVTDVEIVAGDIDAAHVEVINYDNAELAAKIGTLQGDGGAGKILVVRMAGLPLAAFDYMYACSSLPCMLEGKATANLVLNLNIPYLNLLKGTTVVYPTLPLNAVANGAEATLCNNAVLDFKDSAATTNTKLGQQALVLNPASAGFQTTAIYKVAELTRLSYTSGGNLQTYFADLQTFFQNQQEDKLFLSLLYFLSYVNGLDA